MTDKQLPDVIRALCAEALNHHLYAAHVTDGIAMPVAIQRLFFPVSASAIGRILFEVAEHYGIPRERVEEELVEITAQMMTVVELDGAESPSTHTH